MKDFDPKKNSKGLGDTIAKITNATGIDKLAESVAKLAGQEDCGCNSRREKLNNLFPYKITSPPPPLPEKLLGEITGGTYIVNKKLVYTIPDKKGTTIFYPNDKIYINKSMPIFQNLPHYLSNDILTKIEK
tara:strand:- start:236 stop:628 length:393 start_codon:yes stop_codon:yes gene_type:complete